jgi:glycosyltransferase involved in cell wall biosynthesis
VPKKVLNILIFAYWHDKGWQKFVGATVKVWDLAHNAAALGHHVVLFLPKYHFPEENIPFRLVQIPLLDFPFFRALSFNFFLTMYLIRYFFAPKPGVVYIRRGISLIPSLFAKFRKSILFYEINDDPYPDQTNPHPGLIFHINRWISVKTDEISLSLCDAAFVISKTIKEKIVEALPNINHEKLHIMPSGANTDLYRPLDQKQCRLQLSLEPSKRYIGFMGTLLDHQGVDVLVDAAPFVIQLFPDAVFVIIGEGPMKDIWRRRVNDLCLIENFLFTGQIEYEETPLWINSMDVCTAPFLIKAGLRSPVKVFDYMACGKSIVASRIEGTTDMFDSSGAITLVEPGDAQELSDAIIDLLSNRETADRMGRKGRELILEKYDRRIIAERIADEALSFIA